MEAHYKSTIGEGSNGGGGDGWGGSPLLNLMEGLDKKKASALEGLWGSGSVYGGLTLSPGS